MKKRAGFTLIEVLVAIAVLSVMTGVLLRVFTMSARISNQSAKDERAVNLARETMELFKGYPLEKAEGHSKNGTITIRNEEWSFVKEETTPTASGEGAGLYRFARTMEQSGETWYIEVNADYGTYQGLGAGRESESFDEEPEDESEASQENQAVLQTNLYQMPRIADVSSGGNALLTPDDLGKEDELLVNRLLAKVNPAEEDEEGESGGESEGGSGGGSGGDDESTIYDESAVRRILHIMIDEKNGGRNMKVSAQLVYTVASEETNLNHISDCPSDLTLKEGIYSETKTVRLSEDGRKMENAIYVFLPEAPIYEKIFISAVSRRDQISYPLYLIAPVGATGTRSSDYSALSEFVTKPAAVDGDYEIVNLLSNVPETAGTKPVLVEKNEAYNRIYGLDVSIYRYGGESNPKGTLLMNITSTKRE